MLEPLIAWSLRRPLLALGLGVLAALAGLMAAPGLHLRLLPDYAPATIVVRTEASGVSPAEVEQLITRPVEIALSGTPRVSGVNSTSAQGLSVVTLDLQPGVDERQVRQAAAERLEGIAARLPAAARSPQILPILAAGAPVRRIALRSARLDPARLRRLAEWTLRPRLLGLTGVAQVAVYGGEVQRMEVQGRPGDLSDSDLSLLDLVKAATRASSVAGAGFIDTPQQRVLLEPHGEALTADDIAAGQIQVPAAAPVRISDVADVKEAPTPALGDALVDGRPGVVLYVSGQRGAAPLEVTRRVDAALAVLAPSLKAQGVEVETDIGGPADEIRAALASGVLALLLALVLILVLLGAALLDPRSILVSVASLLVSLLVALAAMRIFALPLDAMSVGGLALGLGVIIDDAVLDVEYIAARLAEAAASPMERAEAVLRGSLEVRGPVFVATLLVAGAIAPMLLAPGVQGAVVRPLALAALIAVAASLVVSALFTPALALFLVRPSRAPRLWLRTADEAIARWRGGFKGRGSAIAVALAGLAAAAAAATLDFDPAPSFRSDRITVETLAAPSLSRAAATELMGRLGLELQNISGVARSAARIGLDPTDQTSDGLGVARFDLDLAPGLPAARQDAIEQAARRILASYPGLQARVSSRTYAGVAADEVQGGSPFRLELLGADYDELSRLAREAAGVLRALKGAKDVRVSSAATMPVMRARVNFPKLAIYGLSAADVSDTVQAAFSGRRVGVLYDGFVPVDLVVTAARKGLEAPEQAGDLLLRSTSGIATPLTKVADVRLEEAPARLDHKNGERVVTVEAAPDDVHDFARRARAALASKAKPPPGVTEEVHETSPGQALGPWAWAAVVGGLGAMALLLVFAFRNPRTSLVILANAVLAFAGAIAAVRLLHGRIDLGVLAGLVVVLGLSARSAILVVSRLDRRIAAQGVAWSEPTVLAVARDRFFPALLSGALVLAAIVPAAMAPSPAEALLRAMAVTILGGVLGGGLLAAVALPGFIFWAWRPLGRPERGDR